MGILDGKVAIITGGGQGIGEGLVYAFCKEGAKVVNVGRTLSKVERVAEKARKAGGDVLALQCDVSDRASMDAVAAKAVEAYGKIDILVNNAMTQHLVPFEETTEEDMWDAYKNNVLGTFVCVKACFPYLKEAQGRIINFSSGSATHGSSKMVSYGSSKGAIMSMTKILAVELAKYKINVNCVVPTAVTPSFEKLYSESTPERRAQMLNGYLITREKGLGDPEEDVGGVVLFLASKYSQYMTGRTLFADGGKAMIR